MDQNEGDETVLRRKIALARDFLQSHGPLDNTVGDDDVEDAALEMGS